MVSARRTDLKATFGSKRHELNVSTYQMVVLLLFNAADRLSYREIQAATAIAPADLQRSLQSLACVKARRARGSPGRPGSRAPPPPLPPPFRAACPAGKYGDCARRRLRRPGAHAAVSGAAPSRRAPRRPDEDSLLTYTVQRMLERVLLLLLFSRSGRHPAGSATALRRRPRSACPSGAAPRRAAAAWAAAGAGGAWRLRASRPG